MSQGYGKVGVLGYGLTGQSVVRHLLSQNIEPLVLDTRSADQLKANTARVELRTGVTSLRDLDLDTLVVSPGIDWRGCLMQTLPGHVAILSDIDLFFHQANRPVLGITGTNGKSTVTSLAGHFLNQRGLTFKVGGNLGEAALDLLDDQADGYVLELSSFQLERSGKLPLAAATILNITEDHLDKHGSLDDYSQAKQRIYHHTDYAVVNRADPRTSPASDVTVIASFGLDAPTGPDDWGLIDQTIYAGANPVCDAASLSLKGAHNLVNAMAAGALVNRFVSHDAVAPMLTNFTGLAHRFETVATINGVTCINDSKATNVGATIAALEGFAKDGKVVLVGGGDAKGADFGPLVEVMQGRVKYLSTIGQDGGAMVQVAAEKNIQGAYADTLEQAVADAFAQCTAGDTLLLSPACASIDMFANFAQRGEQFAQAVRALGEVS
ncbi:MAG: UDP-N-acetylmuramoyl-L-alanine--D-glutamate ligase [Pseudomonadota bacterium]